MSAPPWSAEEIAQIRAAADGVPVDDEYIDTWHDDRRWLVTLDAERAAREAAEAKALRLERDGMRLADEVAILIRRGWLSSRSPVADALLDFREPPESPRADRLAAAEARARALEAAVHRLLSTSVSDPAWGDRAAELRALVDALERKEGVE